jgi:hypothetical protein
LVKKDLFDALKDRAFGVEHAINMHARRFFTLPAASLYNRDFLEAHSEIIEKCHIYMVVFCPSVELKDVTQDGRMLKLSYFSIGKNLEVIIDLPVGLNLAKRDGKFFLQDESGEEFFPDPSVLAAILKETHGIPQFKVKYIGQAFGSEGDRNALDRLTHHETLQKISLLGPPPGHSVQLLLIEVEPDNQVIMFFNPFAADHDSDLDRIDQGMCKLFNTTEQERVALYEACMIRYFQPEFNKTYRDSFPSTRLKLLHDCYEKDIAAVSAELAHEEMPFVIFSETVEPSNIHFAQHDLHTEAARKFFFAK